MFLIIFSDSKHVYFFYLLNVVIQPPRINKTLKPSILDAQNDMIVHLVSLDDFKQKEDELKELATKEGLKLLPKIFVVGESISNLTEFYVYLNGILYKMKSVLSAADLIIKISLLFKLEFSAKSRYVWMFLQEYFYEIPLPEKIPKIINVLSKLHK